MAWTTPAIIFLIISALRGASGDSLVDAATAASIRRALTPAVSSLKIGPATDASAAEPRSKETELRSKDPEPRETEPEPRGADPERRSTEPERPSNEPDLWRERMAQACLALERDQLLAEAIQGRLNGLTTDVMNRDDPAQRAELVKQRARVLAEAERLAAQIAKDALAISSIEDEARKKGIPPGWIR